MPHSVRHYAHDKIMVNLIIPIMQENRIEDVTNSGSTSFSNAIIEASMATGMASVPNKIGKVFGLDASVFTVGGDSIKSRASQDFSNAGMAYLNPASKRDCSVGKGFFDRIFVYHAASSVPYRG